jgi:hypothetical protein
MTMMIGGALLTDDQASGRTCYLCPLTFGRLDPVQAPAGVEGVLFLAAHPSCVRTSVGDPGTEGTVAASGRPERSRDD